MRAEHEAVCPDRFVLCCMFAVGATTRLGCMAKWKAGLAGLLIVPLLLGAQSSCGSGTEKRKPRPKVTVRCTKSASGKLNCNKPSRPVGA